MYVFSINNFQLNYIFCYGEENSMLIRPISITDNPAKETSFRCNSYKNDLYMSRVDAGLDPYTGDIIYDVVLISEIIGDVPGANEYDPKDVYNLSKMFGKIVHYFVGRISEGNIDLNNPNEVFENMSLSPIISHVSSFCDNLSNGVNLVQFYKYDTKVYTTRYYNDSDLNEMLPIDIDERVSELETNAKSVIELDIPNPLYPALREYKDRPSVANLDPYHIYKGREFTTNIPNLKIHNVIIDFVAEEKMNNERNSVVRKLLESPVDDEIDDPLLDRLNMGCAARNIAIDFMKADLGGMMESCTLIFDNKIQQSEDLHCGFKSIVSPFGEVYRSFTDRKSIYIAKQFENICRVNIGITEPIHYRVSLCCNQYEIIVKISILDNETMLMMRNHYDSKMSVTIKMKKSEAITDFVNLYLHKLAVLDNYYGSNRLYLGGK